MGSGGNSHTLRDGVRRIVLRADLFFVSVSWRKLLKLLGIRPDVGTATRCRETWLNGGIR